MAVVECSCGMVMSISAAKPRIRCIRCGGVKFQELEHGTVGSGGLSRPAMRTVGSRRSRVSLIPLGIVATMNAPLTTACYL